MDSINLLDVNLKWYKGNKFNQLDPQLYIEDSAALVKVTTIIVNNVISITAVHPSPIQYITGKRQQANLFPDAANPNNFVRPNNKLLYKLHRSIDTVEPIRRLTGNPKIQVKSLSLISKSKASQKAKQLQFFISNFCLPTRDRLFKSGHPDLNTDRCPYCPAELESELHRAIDCRHENTTWAAVHKVWMSEQPLSKVPPPIPQNTQIWLYATFENQLLRDIVYQVRFQLWKIRNAVIIKNQPTQNSTDICKLALTEAVNFLEAYIARSKYRKPGMPSPTLSPGAPSPKSLLDRFRREVGS